MSRSKKSRRSSGAPELPPAFVNRSLGRHRIGKELRATGFSVHLLHEVYPDETLGDRTPDPVWIERAAKEGWVVFSKERRLERGENLEAIRKFGARVFVLPRAHLTEAEQIERFIVHRHRIAQHAQKPGPYVCRVYRDRPKQVWPKSS